MEKIITIVFILCFLIIGAAFIFVNIKSNDAKKEVDYIFRLLIEKNLETAYGYTSSGFKNECNLEKFKENFSQIGYPIELPIFMRKRFSKEEIMFSGSYKTNLDSNSLVLFLKNEGGEWKIDTILTGVEIQKKLVKSNAMKNEKSGFYIVN